MLDGLIKEGGIVLICNTNKPWIIDTGYLSRFPKVTNYKLNQNLFRIFIDLYFQVIPFHLPDLDTRYKFVEKYLEKKNKHHTITYEEFKTINTNMFSFRKVQYFLLVIYAI